MERRVNSVKVVAYCRVSTNKSEQHDSLENQQKFFKEYAKKNQHTLLRIYADEGKSGTKMKNRYELLQLMSDARKKEFELVLVKDVSRLARNTLDFLQSIRKLRELGIGVVFVNYDQTSIEGGELLLTMMSAIAQEESANTSKRIKFGKEQNANNGRVPNLVYGYDKIIGDYFSLSVNVKEADVVRRIFRMYNEDRIGTNRIAKLLNEEGIQTKRQKSWTQVAVRRILSNEIYKGVIINGKEEVADFLTGKRNSVTEDKWKVIERPDLRIISKEEFEKASKLLEERKNSFLSKGEKEVRNHLFSKLIVCKHCGASYRRIVRTYKKTYIKWVCSTRNLKGANMCENAFALDEGKLIEKLTHYIKNQIMNTNDSNKIFLSELKKSLRIENDSNIMLMDSQSRLNKLKKEKEKYRELFLHDLLTIDELKHRDDEIQQEITKITNKIKYISMDITKVDGISMYYILHQKNISNIILHKVLEKIEVDEIGQVHIYFNAL